jgi:hypothetical protein
MKPPGTKNNHIFRVNLLSCCQESYNIQYGPRDKRTNRKLEVLGLSGKPNSPEFNSFSTCFVTLSTAMRVKDLTRVQFLSVPCPTCGAGLAKCCLNSSGDERAEPHLGRKLSVVEIVETKGIQHLEGGRTGKQL